MSGVNTVFPADELPKMYMTELTDGLKVGDSVWEVDMDGSLVDCPVCGATGRISYDAPNWPKYMEKPTDIICPCCKGFKKIYYGKKATVVEFMIHQIDLEVTINKDGVNATVEAIWLDENCIRCFDERRSYVSKEQAEEVCAEMNKEAGFVGEN